MNAAASSGEPVGQIGDIFKRQQAHALQLRTSTAAERIVKIKKLLASIEAHEYHIYLAAQADFGKPEAEVDLTELLPVTAEARHTIAHLKKWMKPKRISPTLAMVGTSAQVRHEPKGVTLIIAPWNYPLNLALGPLISAIAAGNTAIIKPSEHSPQMAAITRKIVEAAFEPEEVAVFEGEVAVSTELLALPFNHIFFTGSSAVGKIVMAAAAKNLSSVTLELGGKSPCIVDQSANIKKAARNIVWGKFTNNGQTCISPDYLLVHRSIRIEFIEEAIRCIKQSYGQTDAEQLRSRDYCRIVDQRHCERLIKLLEDAKSRGANICAGGKFDAGQRFIAPTLLVDVALDTDIMQEEIFGPLLPILNFDDIDDAIKLVNSKPKPLALYIYSREATTTEKVLAETSAGGTCINHNMVHFLHLNLPFGGVNNSGIGESHGHWGFRAFSHQRAVLKDRLTVFHLLHPPYTARVKKLIKLVVKYLA